MTEMTYAEAIRDGMRQEMKRDQNVYLFGEDVGIFGGCFGVTAGLFQEFGPERVIDTPITETAIVGERGGRRRRWPEADRRDHVRRFHGGLHGRDPQPGRQDEVHVRR